MPVRSADTQVRIPSRCTTPQAPPRRCLDPGEQLRKAQWLRDVVVCPELEAANLVGLRAPGRGHDDRDAAELADPLGHMPAVEPRDRDVEDDQIRMVVIEPAKRL